MRPSDTAEENTSNSAQNQMQNSIAFI